MFRTIVAIPTVLLLSIPAVAAPELAPMPRETPTSFEVPYKLTDSKHIMVRIKLNGKGPFNFILDTGAPALIMTEAVAKKTGAELEKEWGTFKLELEGGIVVPNARGLAHDMFQLKGMNSMGLAGVELHGVIGYNILAKYKIQYDFTADKLGFTALNFEPPKMIGIGQKAGPDSMSVLGDLMKFLAPLLGLKPNFEVRPRGFIGLELVEEKKSVIVKSVIADSPAAKVGLQAGDQITYAGKNDAASIEDVMAAVAKLGEGEKLKLKYKRNNQTKEVTIELGRGL